LVKAGQHLHRNGLQYHIHLWKGTFLKTIFEYNYQTNGELMWDELKQQVITILTSFKVLSTPVHAI
jgi:hypothetical protein